MASGCYGVRAWGFPPLLLLEPPSSARDIQKLAASVRQGLQKRVDKAFSFHFLTALGASHKSQTTAQCDRALRTGYCRLFDAVGI